MRNDATRRGGSSPAEADNILVRKATQAEEYDNKGRRMTLPGNITSKVGFWPRSEIEVLISHLLEYNFNRTLNVINNRY
jgi:hypothetical protein